MSSPTTTPTVHTDLWDWAIPSRVPWLSQTAWIRSTRTRQRVCGIEVPNDLSHLVAAVEKSKWMLKLEDNWDDVGSPSYSKQTWEQAVRFLLASALEIWNATSRRIPAPEIQNGPEGSIDIFWETEHFTLLINVPPGNDQATYYGSKIQDNEIKGGEIKGTLDVRRPTPWLLMWAME